MAGVVAYMRTASCLERGGVVELLALIHFEPVIVELVGNIQPWKVMKSNAYLYLILGNIFLDGEG